jgi:hypothetical protein
MAILAWGWSRQTLGLSTDLTESQLLSLVNLERQKINLQPLAVNPLLTKAAIKKAEAMVAANIWSHNLPESTPWTFVDGQGYRYQLAGENLAKDFLSSQAVITAWLNSPSHKANMLAVDYSETGIAILEADFQGKKQTTLIVQLLAKPLAADQTLNQSPEITNSGLMTAKDQLEPNFVLDYYWQWDSWFWRWVCSLSNQAKNWLVIGNHRINYRARV